MCGMQRVATDFMMEADPEHPGGFLAPSGGFKGLVHNGCVLPSHKMRQGRGDVVGLTEGASRRKCIQRAAYRRHMCGDVCAGRASRR